MQRAGVLRRVMPYYTDHYATRALTQFKSDRRHENRSMGNLELHVLYISFAAAAAATIE